MVMRHTEDDGELSVFAADDQLLFACSKGHFWIVDAQQQGSAAAVRGPASMTSRSWQDLGARFGDDVVHLLRD